MMKFETDKLKKIYQYILKNKFKITFAIFFVWILFIDDYNIIRLFKYNSEVNRLEKQKKYIETKLTEDSEKLFLLKTDNQSLEKFAREEYFMHKPNEEVIVIKEID